MAHVHTPNPSLGRDDTNKTDAEAMKAAAWLLGPDLRTTRARKFRSISKSSHRIPHLAIASKSSRSRTKHFNQARKAINYEVSSTRIYLGNLSLHVTKADIEAHFQEALVGEIAKIEIMDGYGFIEYVDAMDARDAVPLFHGTYLMEKRLVVQFARSKWTEDVPPEQSNEAVRMRPMKACIDCIRWNDGCDTGTPCLPCLERSHTNEFYSCRGKKFRNDRIHSVPEFARNDSVHSGLESIDSSPYFGSSGISKQSKRTDLKARETPYERPMRSIICPFCANGYLSEKPFYEHIIRNHPQPHVPWSPDLYEDFMRVLKDKVDEQSRMASDGEDPHPFSPFGNTPSYLKPHEPAHAELLPFLTPRAPSPTRSDFSPPISYDDAKFRSSRPLRISIPDEKKAESLPVSKKSKTPNPIHNLLQDKPQPRGNGLFPTKQSSHPKVTRTEKFKYTVSEDYSVDDVKHQKAKFIALQRHCSHTTKPSMRKPKS